MWLFLLTCFWGPQELVRPSKKVQILDSWFLSMPKKTKHWVRLVWKKCPVSKGAQSAWGQHRKCKNIGHFAVLFAKLDFYYWSKLENRLKNFTGAHMCTQKQSLSTPSNMHRQILRQLFRQIFCFVLWVSKWGFSERISYMGIFYIVLILI